MKKTIIGIIGGMGPEAGVQLFLKITKNTTIIKEQDHFHVILDSNPQIPDRTRSILYGEPSPVEAIAASANRLYQAGARVGMISCMTAHYFFNEVQAKTELTLIHAFKELNEYLKKEYPKALAVGVLCTDGTKETKLFDQFLEHKVIYPNSDMQKNVMEGIYGKEGVKQGFTIGKPVEQFKKAAESLICDGADVVIGGCTEIGLVMHDKVSGVDIVNPLDVLAYKVCELE